MDKYKFWVIALVIASLLLIPVGGLDLDIGKIGSRSTIGKVLTIGFADQAYAAAPDYEVDGAADDVQAQQALDDLPSTGGKIIFYAGAYNFTATVSRAINNVTMEGSGRGTYFTYDASNAIFSIGSQEGWIFRDFSTDAGGITLASGTDYRLENVLVGTSGYNYVRTATVVVATNSTSVEGQSQADYVGDGVSDNVEIQAAIDNLPSTGGKVVLLEGEYRISAAILLDPGTTLEGQGGWSIYGPFPTQLTLDNGVDDSIVKNRTPNANESNIYVRDIFFYGNKDGQSAGSGIYFDKVKRSGIENVAFNEIKDDAITLANYCQVVDVNKVLSMNLGRHGIFLDGPDNWIRNCDITTSTDDYAIYLGTNGTNNIIQNNNLYIAYGGLFLGASSNKNLVMGNRFDLNTNRGVSNSGSLNVFSGNRFLSNGVSGMVDSGGYSTFTGNTIDGIHAYGVYITSGADHTIIDSNYVYNTSAYGVWLVDVSDVVVTGNLIDTGWKGIMLDESVGSLADIVINSNRADNLTTGIELDNATDYITILGNNLRGNTNGITDNSGGVNNIIDHNQVP